MYSRSDPEGHMQVLFLENQTKPYYGWMSCEMEPDNFDMLHTDVPLHWTQKTENLCTDALVPQETEVISGLSLEAELTFGVTLNPLSVLDNYPDTEMKYRYLDSSCEETLYQDPNMILINDMSHGYNCHSDNQQVPDSEILEDYMLLTREVEGCEDPKFDVNGGTLSESQKHAPRSSSKKRKHESGFVPRASSTMIEDNTTPSKRGKVSRKSKPCASSTMIIEDNSPVTSNITGHNSPELQDLQSIYTWSIHDSSPDASYEESFMKGHNLIVKPPVLKRTVPKHVSCESFSFTMESITLPHELDNDRESMYEKDEEFCGKINSEQGVSHISKINNSQPITTYHQVQTADINSMAFCKESEFHEVPSSSMDDEAPSCSMGDDDVFYSIQERQEPTEILHQASKSSKLFKFPKNTLQLKKLFKWKKFKGKTSNDNFSIKGDDCDSSAMCHGGRQQISQKTTDFITVQDRKTVMTNFKRFKANVN